MTPSSLSDSADRLAWLAAHYADDTEAADTLEGSTSFKRYTALFNPDWTRSFSLLSRSYLATRQYIIARCDIRVL